MIGNIFKIGISIISMTALFSIPAFAATINYVGPRLQSSSGTNSGFTRIRAKFTLSSSLAPNTSYVFDSTMSNFRLVGYSDGVNNITNLDSYLAKGMAYGGGLDSYYSLALSTDGAGKIISWTFKINVYFVDSYNEGYDLYVNGPGNAQSCPTSACGYDSLVTTLPETLPTTEDLSSSGFGKLTYTN